MNLTKVLFLMVSLIIFDVNGFPQSASEIAIATKLTEQNYYNIDVKFFSHESKTGFY